MRILITGGGGLIGQAIAKRHLQAGDEVFIYDNNSNSYNDYTNLVGTILPTAFYSIGDALYDHKPDVISNQAALVGVGQSQYQIGKYTINNIGFTAYLLESIIGFNYRPNKILHAGSMGPYGNAKLGERVFETQPQNPQSVYAITKQAQENLIRVFSDAYDIPAISLRYFSVYGTEQNPLNPYTGVLSIIANQCLNSDVIEIYEDGEQTRDLVHIDDVAEAHYLACNADLEGFSAFNIGTEKAHPMLAIAVMIRDILSPGKEIITNGKHRKGDIKHMRANTSLARNVLGWMPKHDLYEDITTYCNYILENKEKFTVGNTVKEENNKILSKGLVTDARP